MDPTDDTHPGFSYFVGNEINPEIPNGAGNDNYYLVANDYADHLVPTEPLPLRRRTMESVEQGMLFWFDATNNPSNQGLFALQPDYTWIRSDKLPVGTDIRNLIVVFSHFRGRTCYMQSQPIEFIYPDSETPILIGVDDIHRMYKTSLGIFTNIDGSEILRPFNKNNPIHKSGYRHYFRYNSGPTADRPSANTNNVYNGLMYFDTTLDIPMWFNKDDWYSPYIRIYGTFISTETQYSNKIKSGLTYNVLGSAYKIELMPNNSDVKVLEPGHYMVVLNAQCQKIVNSGTAYDINVWFNINGTDVPYSNRSVYLEASGYYRQISCNLVVFLNAGDRIQAFTNSGSNGRNMLASTPATATTPAIPSVSLYIQRVSRI